MRVVGNIASDSEVVATASGAITAGKPVVVNADGTVGVVDAGITGGFGTAVEFEDARTNTDGPVPAAFDSSNNKVVIVYMDVANSTYGTAIVGTVNASDSSISYGSAVVFNSADTSYVAVTFDSNANKVLIAYTDRGDSKKGKAIVGTISGTSISFGTAAVFDTGSGSDGVLNHRFAFDSNSNKTALFYVDFNDGQSLQSRVVSISGTTPSFGTKVEVAGQVLYGSGNSSPAVFDSNSNKVVVFYNDVGDSNKGKARVGTISGTDISFGTAAEFESGAYSQGMDATFDSSNNKIVLGYQDTSNSYYGTLIVGTVSGTDITFGTAVVWASVTSVTQHGLVYDPSVNRVFISGRYNDKGNYVIGKVSGTTISIGTAAVYLNFTVQRVGLPVYDSNAERIVIPYVINPSGASDRHGFAIVYKTEIAANLTSENFIGFAKDAVADGAVATIQTANSIARDNIGEPTSFTYNNQSFALSGQSITTPEEIRFKPDGTKFYILSGDDDTVYQYSMSTAWDISTASYESKSFSSSSQEGSPQGLAINADGTSFYVCGQTKSIYQYNLSTAYDASTASYASKSFSVGSQITSGTVWSIDFNDTGTILYAISSGGIIYQYTLSTAFDIATASYASKSFDTTSQTVETTGIAVTSDGTGVYVMNYPNDTVFKYTLSTAFDIATASYSNISFTTTSQDTFPYGVAVKTDDSQVYITGSTNDKIFQYSVSTSLTIGQTYFVQTDGTLSTSADDPSVIAGTAISGTDLIVKG